MLFVYRTRQHKLLRYKSSEHMDARVVSEDQVSRQVSESRGTKRATEHLDKPASVPVWQYACQCRWREPSEAVS